MKLTDEKHLRNTLALIRHEERTQLETSRVGNYVFAPRADDGLEFSIGIDTDSANPLVEFKNGSYITATRSDIGVGVGSVNPYKNMLNSIYGCEAKPTDIEIEKVIFNPPATIVFWTDNTKTVVKAENEDFDPEKGLAMAICKKVLGNRGNYYNIFRKWLPKEKPNGLSLNSAVDRMANSFKELSKAFFTEPNNSDIFKDFD